MATEKGPGGASLGLYLGIALIAALVIGLVGFVGFGDSEGGDNASAGQKSTDAATTTSADPTASAAVPAGSGDCSAAAYPGGELAKQAELIAPVAKTRAKIARAAAACDFNAVQSTMGSGFVWGFAPDQRGTSGAIAQWEADEAAGQPVLLSLTRIAALDFADADDGTFVFPAASQWTESDWANASPEEIAALVEVYGQASVDRWTTGSSFDGYRVGIKANGSWFYFAGNAF